MSIERTKEDQDRFNDDMRRIEAHMKPQARQWWVENKTGRWFFVREIVNASLDESSQYVRGSYADTKRRDTEIEISAFRKQFTFQSKAE